MEYWQFPNGTIVDVNEPYYPASCDKCGWFGSSEQVNLINYGDDADCACPSCGEVGADSGKDGDAAKQIESDDLIQRLRAEKTPDFSELFSLLDDMKTETCQDDAPDVPYAEGLQDGHRSAAELIEEELTKIGVKR